MHKMMKFKFLFLLLMLPLASVAQNSNGDRKGTYRSEYADRGDLLFQGKMEKGKLKGEYFNGGKPVSIVMTKFGEGVISLKDPRTIDKKSGLVFY